MGILTARPLPRPDGVDEAAFCIYHGEVSQDSDGPVEWCRPVPVEKAAELASAYPELKLRTEVAHEEAFVDIGPGGKLEATQWLLVSEALRSWSEEHGHLPSELGARIIFRITTPVGAGPDCDFAIPLR